MQKLTAICLKCRKINGFTYYYQGVYRCGEFPNEELCDSEILQSEVSKSAKDNL